MTVSFNSGASTLGDIKAFKDNVSIKSTLSYTVSANLLGHCPDRMSTPTRFLTRSERTRPEMKTTKGLQE